MDRREFLASTVGATLGAAVGPSFSSGARPEGRAYTTLATQPATGGWDAGRVRHLLPAVGESKILLKASFAAPLTAAPTLRVGSAAIRGRMNDTAGECWQFYADRLDPGRRYNLSLSGANGSALCQPWELSTFPRADSRPDRCRVLFFTCAGGPESKSLTMGNLPTAVRNRLLRRALSFRPDAAVANGDHVYWDLHAPRAGAAALNTERLKAFDAGAAVFATTNEAALKQIAAPQILPVYGTDFRSTPVFFLQDDHDYFDNDEGTDLIVTFPPPWFQLQLARATQQLYYPEFLADATRPANLPWSSSSDRGELSESFGTLRFGRLVEVLLYDVRRTMTLAGPTAVLIDTEVEKWLHARNAATDVAHVVHGPSNPPGWSAGKWGEWYPDVLGAENRLTVAQPKPYWQPGWLAQHDRLMQSISAMKRRTPLVVSGDLHAVAIGRMMRAGAFNFEVNPITVTLSGPIGTGPGGWPSAFRGVEATTPDHLDLQEAVKPLEQHGFTLIDFEPDRITVRMFRWDVKTQPPEAIDRLEPFHTTELVR
jgi:hypothetical protein